MGKTRKMETIVIEEQDIRDRLKVILSFMTEDQLDRLDRYFDLQLAKVTTALKMIEDN